jgi:uncharacterized Zn finger protein
MSLVVTLEELRRMARQEASDRIWSQGVSLAREHRVDGQSSTEDEVELDVRVPGRPTPFSVVLNLEDQEWECDCAAKEAVCSHVVASILAMIQHQVPSAEGAAGEAGEAAAPAALPSRKDKARTIRYLLEPISGGVQVTRMAICPDPGRRLGPVEADQLRHH